MKIKYTYLLDDDDSHFKRQIQEAFNRVASFAPELFLVADLPPKPEILKSFNKIVLNGEFEDKDLELLNEYTEILYKRIHDKYDNFKIDDLKINDLNKEALTYIKEGCLQAADNLSFVMEEFSGHFDKFYSKYVMHI